MNEMQAAPVLLTGATGFIGRRIQLILLDAGVPVRVVLRPGSPHQRHVDSRCQVYACALDDVAGLNRVASGASAAIYCAGVVRGRTLDDFLPANVDGVRAVLQALTSQGAATPFLLISSLAAGRPELSDYARSKFLGEQVLRESAHPAWTILRPPAVYGPGDTLMLPILKMARRGLIARFGPRNQRLSLLYADDLASAVKAWLAAWPKCAGMTFSIDDGHEGGYDWPGIVHAAGGSRYRAVGIPSPLLAGIARLNMIVAGMAGYSPLLSPGKVREMTQANWLCDNTAFVQATGWQPRTGLPSGIRLCLDP
jgi:2-alkyl-3-oxoalkanoate reductase